MNRLLLTPQQKTRFESELRQNPKAHVYRRAAALLAAHEGRAVSQIAACLGVTRQTVYNWVDKYGKTGQFIELGDSARSGRPSVWTEELEAALREALDTPPLLLGYRTDRWTTALLRNHLASTTGRTFSDETLRRRMRDLGYTPPSKHKSTPPLFPVSNYF